MADKIFSGVAGAFKSILWFDWVVLEIAWRMAHHAEIASIKGGSPTAFDLKIVFATLGVFCKSSTLKISGTSCAVGIL
jgi:hypothetical protein